MAEEFKNLREMLDHHAREYRDNTFLAFYEEHMTYGEFDKRINRLANALLNLDIDKQQVVAVYQNNSPEMLCSYFALHRIGAVAVPINCWWKPADIAYLLNDSGAVGIIVESSLAENLAGIRHELKDLKLTIEIGGKSSEAISYESLVSESSEDPPESHVEGEDVASLVYTSGTTGNPKGVMLTHKNLLYDSSEISRFIQSQIDMSDEGVLMVFLPLFHNHAFISTLAGYYAAYTVCLRKSFSLSEFWPCVERYKVNLFAAVPTVFNILLLDDTAEKHDFSSLTHAISGGAPLPLETIRKFESRFNVKISEVYGLTEGVAVCTVNPPGESGKFGSVGKPLPRQEVKIFDETDTEVAQGEIGEIVVRGDNVMKGYYNKPEVNREALRGGWLHTGDMGYVDEDGFFYIVDRKKELIIKGGENIYPSDVDDVLYEHPKIQEAAVIGVPDEILGEEIKAFVVLKPGESATPEEIIGFCQERLGTYQVPKYVEFIDSLPKNVIGKVLRRELKKLG